MYLGRYFLWVHSWVFTKAHHWKARGHFAGHGYAWPREGVTGNVAHVFEENEIIKETLDSVIDRQLCSTMKKAGDRVWDSKEDASGCFHFLIGSLLRRVYVAVTPSNHIINLLVLLIKPY
jgi:hypothetical protein